MARCKNRGFGKRPSLVFSVFMIAAGVLLFLANLDLLPFSVNQVWRLWPLVFVAVGLSKISGSTVPSALLLGGLFVIFGGIFTLVSLGLIRIHFNDDSWPLSLVFLALGIGGLAKVLEAGNPRWRQPPSPQSPQPMMDDPAPRTEPPWPAKENWSGWSKPSDLSESPVLDNVAVMASVKRRMEADNFQGGTLTTFWGSIEIDLRRARLPEGRSAVTLDANAVMGSIKLRIPETWRVAWNGISLMANFEDKTIPPTTGSAAPELIVTGYLLMGSIEIES